MVSSKVSKVIQLTAQANEQHNFTKVKSILKWIKSGHEVRVKIVGKPDKKKIMESLADQIERDSKQGARLLQKVIKPDSIKLTLLPTENSGELQLNKDTEEVQDLVEEIDRLTSEKDIFSDEFEKELDKSISEDPSRKRKH